MVNNIDAFLITSNVEELAICSKLEFRYHEEVVAVRSGGFFVSVSTIIRQRTD